MYSSVLWRPHQGSLPQFRLICALFVSAKNKPAAADTDRAAAHSPQASSQLSEVQPLTIMSIHHRISYYYLSHTEGETDDSLHFICLTYWALPLITQWVMSEVLLWEEDFLVDKMNHICCDFTSVSVEQFALLRAHFCTATFGLFCRWQCMSF